MHAFYIPVFKGKLFYQGFKLSCVSQILIENKDQICSFESPLYFYLNEKYELSVFQKLERKKSENLKPDKSAEQISQAHSRTVLLFHQST